jgi:cation transport regulator ChaB
MAQGLPNGLFQAFIDWIYSSGDISVPTGYHGRCNKINEMLDNDISGTIDTILDYAVNSASEANYRVECSETTLQKLLNLWLEEINIDIKGIPTGLQSLSKEYFKERWQGSSFCILRVKDWKKITIDGVTIEVPTTMWFVNGSSIYVSRPKDKNFKLGSDKYYLDEVFKNEIPSGKEEDIIVQKPYNRWFDQYATPYLIRRGVYKNWLAMKVLQEKSDEVISKILPYLFVISKGTENLFLQGDVNYTDEELKELTENFKEQVSKYKNQKGKTPTNAIPFDTKYDHLIPDLSKVLKEELYRQGYRAILSGLGFIDMLEISPSRQESRLNPKAFISEVNEGVCGFKAILLETIYLIEQKNKSAHKKLFSEKGKLIIVNSPLRINVENLLSDLRSGFDRGIISIQSYQEILGVDSETEKERRKKEAEDGLEDLMYPHIINNQEGKGKDTFAPSKPKKQKDEKNEDQNKKKNTPESENFKNADLSLEMAPYKNLEELPKYIKKMTKQCQETFMATFNSVYEDSGDESKAMAIGISAAKRCMKKQGYTYDKETKTWKKKE